MPANDPNLIADHQTRGVLGGQNLDKLLFFHPEDQAHPGTIDAGVQEDAVQGHRGGCRQVTRHHIMGVGRYGQGRRLPILGDQAQGPGKGGRIEVILMADCRPGLHQIAHQGIHGSHGLRCG